MSKTKGEDVFRQAAEIAGVSPLARNLGMAIGFQESGLNPSTQESKLNNKVGNAAIGMMQVTKKTFADLAKKYGKDWGNTNINDPVTNAAAGLRYVQEMLDLGGGDPRLAAIGYYGGPGAIKAAKEGVARKDPRNPNAPDTFQYADSAMKHMAKLGFVSNGLNQGVSPVPVQKVVKSVPSPITATSVSQAPKISFGDEVSNQLATIYAALGGSGNTLPSNSVNVEDINYLQKLGL